MEGGVKGAFYDIVRFLVVFFGCFFGCFFFLVLSTVPIH